MRGHPESDQSAVDATDVERLAGEILRYLSTHREAADTAEGIARWWIKRQRLEDTVARVQVALDRLVERSLVEPHASAAGGTRYQLRGLRSAVGEG